MIPVYYVIVILYSIDMFVSLSVWTITWSPIFSDVFIIAIVSDVLILELLYTY